jgi:WD40 repeat protein
MLSVFRWNDNEVLFTAQVSREKCFSLVFLADNTVAVGGESYLYLWTKAPEGFEKRKGNFGSFTVQPITCLVAVQGASLDTVVAGTVSGQLSLWIDRNCVRFTNAHRGSVNCLYSTTHGLISGGMDHRIRMWTNKLEPGATFDISGFGNSPSVRSVCCSTDGRTVLVGTKGGSVHEISAIDGSDMRGGPLASGHSTGQLRSIVTHPSKQEFLTVGDDMRLRIWCILTHTLLKIANFDAEVRASAYSPLGDSICVGLGKSSPQEPGDSDSLEIEINEKAGDVIMLGLGLG